MNLKYNTWTSEIKEDSSQISFEITQNQFNSNINNLLEIKWTWLSLVEYVNIWWISFPVKYENKNIYVLIDKWTFWNWEFFVILKLQNWKFITGNKKIIFTFKR